MRFTVRGQFDPLYCGFYVEGMRRLGKVHYRPLAKAEALRRVRFEVNGRRIVINADDGPLDDPSAKADTSAAKTWADYYAAVNPQPGEIPAGPSFGVRTRIPKVDRRTVTMMLRLPPESVYQPASSDPGYVFHLATLWKKEPDTNRYRANFCTAADKLIGLDGGFAPRADGNAMGYDHFITKRVSHRKWLQRTRRSVAVFNTPAVWGCHGWKLGEYLALGKAIISTPLCYPMPEPLVDGEHVLFVDGSEAQIVDALQRVRSDHELRRQLEKNARNYYERLLAPQAVIARLLDL